MAERQMRGRQQQWQRARGGKKRKQAEKLKGDDEVRKIMGYRHSSIYSVEGGTVTVRH